MPYADSTDAIRSLLSRLAAYESISGFSQIICEAIAGRLEGEAPARLALRSILARHLRAEVLFHGSLAGIADGRHIALDDMAALADRRRIVLRGALDMLDEIGPSDDADLATGHLLAAECWHILEDHGHVVSHLERAIDLGADHPVFHLALGYNRYTLAREAFTSTEAETQESLVLDEPRYRAALLEAVSAFEAGLSGGFMDAQLYWWMGTCLKEAGFAKAGEHALAQARNTAQRFADISALSRQRDAEAQRVAELPPISVDELREVRRRLKRSYSITEVLGDGY